MADRPLIGDAERRRRLAWRHRLVPDALAPDVPTVVDDLVALHSSDPVTVHLSAAARLASPSLASVERALYEDRAVVRHHAMRRTLWVMTPTVASAAHASSTIKIAGAELRRHEKQLGWSAGRLRRAVDRVADAVGETPTTTAELGEALPELAERVTLAAGTGSETTVNTLSRVLLLAGFGGRILRHRPPSWVSSQYSWVEPWVDFPREAGRHAEVLARWLARFGPGTEVDLVWWTGWTKTAVRRVLAEIEAVEVELHDGSTGWVLPDDVEATEAPDPWVAILPGLDPTSMGWKQRAWYLDDAITDRVVDRSGNIGPTIWADGRIIGGWAQRPDGAIAMETYAPVDQDLLEDAIERLVGVVGEGRFRPRFPSPNQRDLLS